MCQHLEDVPNSMNQHFPNDQHMMLQWVTSPFKLQDRPMNFNLKECESSLVRLQIPLPNESTIGGSSKKISTNYLKKVLKHSSLFQRHICVRPDFLHTVQPKHIAID